MIIFGVRNKLLKILELTGEKCSHCGNSGTVALEIYQRYFHIMWVPAFPVGKMAYSVCSHCKQTLSESQMSPVLLGIASQEKKKVKAPWYMYIFLMIVGVIWIVIPLSMAIIGAIID